MSDPFATVPDGPDILLKVDDILMRRVHQVSDFDLAILWNWYSHANERQRWPRIPPLLELLKSIIRCSTPAYSSYIAAEYIACFYLLILGPIG